MALMPTSSAGLGRPVQVAYAVRDLAPSIDRWVETTGAGPFYVLEHIALRSVRYRGVEGSFDHSSAYGQWGDLMVELVRDDTAGRSPVRDVVGHRGEGLHHLAFFVDDLEAEVRRLGRLGWAEAMWAETSVGTAFAFCDSTAELGHMVELYEPTEQLVAFYEMVAFAARGWDGSGRLRLLGSTG